MNNNILNKDHIMPQQIVSADHYIKLSPGWIYHTRGKSDPHYIYCGGCIFVDNFSGLMSIKNQVDINATKIFKSKLTLDRWAQIQVVVITG